MWKILIAVAFLLASGIVRADTPETVVATYSPKAGKEAELQQLIHTASALYRRLGMVSGEEILYRDVDKGGKPVFVNVLTWKGHDVPDNAPPPVLDIWKKLEATCEKRDGRAGIEFHEVSLLGSGDAVTEATQPSASSHYAALDGARIHYEVVGSGARTLVFIHGWGGDTNVWRQQLPYFSSKARLLLIDLPGHGLSDKPRLSYTMPYFARAVQAVMDDAGVRQAVLIGHSMGTPVIREFYRRFPERVEGLVAVDGALQNPVDPKAAEGFIAPLRAADGAAVAARRIAGMMPKAEEALRQEVSATAGRTPPHVLVSAMEGMMLDPEIWKDDPIAVPLLVINQNAPFWTKEYEAYVKKIAPRADYQVMDGVDHFLMLEKPAEFNDRLAAWLQKMSGKE